MNSERIIHYFSKAYVLAPLVGAILGFGEASRQGKDLPTCLVVGCGGALGAEILVILGYLYQGT